MIKREEKKLHFQPPSKLIRSNFSPFLPLAPCIVSVATQDDEDNHSVAQGHDGAGVLHKPLVGVEHRQRYHAHKPDGIWGQEGVCVFMY